LSPSETPGFSPVARAVGVILGLLWTGWFLLFAFQSVGIDEGGVLISNWYGRQYLRFDEIARFVLRFRFFRLLAYAETKDGHFRAVNAIAYPGTGWSGAQVRAIVAGLNALVEDHVEDVR
jgi:hypothetical protein